MVISRYLFLIGIFIFVYVLWNINIIKFIEILNGVDILFLSISFLIIFPSIWLKSLKWKVFINAFGIDCNTSDLLKIWLKGFSISMITPARLGDISRAYFLRKRVKIGKGITSVVLDRIIDVFLLFFFAIIGISSLVLIYLEFSGILYIFIILFIVFLIFLFIISKKNTTIFLLKPIFRKFIPKKHKTDISINFKEFYKGFKEIRNNKKSVIYALIIGIITWFISVFQYYLLALSINLNLSYMFLFSAMAVVALLDALPISFSGIGTRDLALITLFSTISISKEYAISYSFLVLLFSYVFIGLFGAFLLLRNTNN